MFHLLENYLRCIGLRVKSHCFLKKKGTIIESAKAGSKVAVMVPGPNLISIE